MGVRPAWLVGSSAHRSCVWLDHVCFAAGAPLHSHLRYHISPTRAIRRPCLGRCLRLSWNTAVSDIFFRLITTARLTLHSSKGLRVRGCHIYVLAVQVVRPGDPLICASRAWRWTALVAHFDGSCHGLMRLEVLGSLCGNLRMTTRSLPKRPTPFLTARTPTTLRALQVHTRSRPLRAFTPIIPMYRNVSSLRITPPS